MRHIVGGKKIYAGTKPSQIIYICGQQVEEHLAVLAGGHRSVAIHKQIHNCDCFECIATVLTLGKERIMALVDEMVPVSDDIEKGPVTAPGDGCGEFTSQAESERKLLGG